MAVVHPVYQRRSQDLWLPVAGAVGTFGLFRAIDRRSRFLFCRYVNYYTYHTCM